MPAFELTQELAREFADYDPETSAITWKKRDPRWFTEEKRCRAWNTSWAGKPTATKPSVSGYPVVKIFGNRFYAHRFIFMWMTGVMPEQVDHDNGNRLDNRWSNLKAANFDIQIKNMPLRSDNKSGVPGVFWNRHVQLWETFIAGKRILRTTSKRKAIAARKQAERELNYNPHHGRLP